MVMVCLNAWVLWATWLMDVISAICGMMVSWKKKKTPAVIPNCSSSSNHKSAHVTVIHHSFKLCLTQHHHHTYPADYLTSQKRKIKQKRKKERKKERSWIHLNKWQSVRLNSKMATTCGYYTSVSIDSLYWVHGQILVYYSFIRYFLI